MAAIQPATWLVIGCLVCGSYGYSNQEYEDAIFLSNILRDLVVLEGGIYSDESEAQQWVDDYNEELRSHKNLEAIADWNYLTNITDETSSRLQEVEVLFSEFSRRKQEEGAKFYQYNSMFQSESLRRELLLINISTVPTPRNHQDMTLLTNVTSQMKTLYATGTLQDETGTVYHLEPELTEILANSRNYSELLWAWKGFRDVTGRLMRDLYTTYVDISNEAARDSGLDDMGDAWQMSCYEVSDMESLADELWGEIEPLYTLLHAYVRHKLTQIYPGEFEPDEGIPAHILGNMWAQEWQNLADDMMPHPEVPLVDVTAELQRQNYTAERMFRLAENYFSEIGLNNMTDTFWAKSMIEKPTDREVECHGSASDFYEQDDYRIKMCTDVDMNYLQTVHHEMGHVEYFMQYAQQTTVFRIKMCTIIDNNYLYIATHEMGHIEYFMQYKDQPAIFREGANCAFHEAVGDTIALMVNTPEHLRKIGLLHAERAEQTTEDQMLNVKRDINFLMKIAMEKLPLLPFALVVEKWRYSVFRGETDDTNYNEKWWDLRNEFQGLIPPVERRDPRDFDPGAKYHVAADVPYLRYFLSFVVQFQFHKQLCDDAGNIDPMHHCDIYGTTDGPAAGRKFGEMLAKGRSEPWKDILQFYTGQREIKATALLKFFRPLKDWLTKYIEDNNIPLGW